MADQHGTATYTVDWSGQGYEQLAKQLRDFLALKRRVDQELRRGLAGGPATPGLVDAGGRPLSSGAAARASAADAAYETSRRQAGEAQRRYARSLDQETRQHERQATQRRRQDNRAAGDDFARRLRQFRPAPAVFGGLADTGGLQSDEEWGNWTKAVRDRYTQAVKTNEQLNAADRDILTKARAIGGIMGQHAQEAGKQGFSLGRVASMAGWLPGIPPQLYQTQMALGEMGLGLGAPAVGVGMAAVGYGLLSAAVYNSTASQIALARMVAGISPSGSGIAATPADQRLADTLTHVGAAFRLDQRSVFSLLPTAAQYNLPAGALAPVVTGGLTRAAQGELTNEQGVQLQALVASHVTGGDADQAAEAFAKLDDAIKQTGADTHTVYSDILQQGDALRAGMDLTQFATLDAALKGSGLSTQQVFGSGLQTTGAQRLAQAASFNMSEQQYIALQGQPAAYAQRLQQFARQTMAETGGSLSATEAVLEGLGLMQGGPDADAALHEILQGNYRPPAPTTPPKTPAQLRQQTIDTTKQAEGAVESSAPIQDTLGILKDQVLRAIGEGNRDVNGGSPVPGALASLGDWWAVGFQAVRHLVDITVHDPAGNVLGTASVTLGQGGSTQTPTATPGPGPSRNVATRPSPTPNATNTNGRTITSP